MNNLKVIGTEHVGKYEFTGIEGGFGEDKKAMLVKDIAAIHGKEVRVVNQNIERNRKRFVDGVDIVDLKQNSVITLSDLGFNQNQINRSTNIYLLSERGYSKLLKILEDDTAWEIYDQFVDNYFNLRQAQPALPTTPMEILETTFQAIKETDSKVDAVASRLDKFEDDQEIRNWEQEELLHLRRNKVFAVLGGRNSRQYKALSSDVFKAISKDFKSQFNVPRYNATPRKRFDDAKRFFMNWEPSDLLGFAIKGAEAD